MADGSGWAAWALNAAYAGGTLAAGALLLLYMFQEKLLYFPTIPGASKFTQENPRGYRNPGEYGIDYEDLAVTTADGVRVHAWLMKQAQPATCPTLIFFHGNAGNIGYRLPNAVQMHRKIGANIVLVDYRGFGHSEGEPSEKGLKLDAEAVLDAIHARPDLDNTKIVLFGRSLGGAVAVYLADKEPSRVSAVILENTFLSISAMVDALMPALSYVKALVLRMDWNSAAVIQRVRQPILLVAGLQDELVPHSHMKTLRELATASKKVVWYGVPNGTHNDSWLRGGEAYFAELKRFLSLVGGSSSMDESCLADDGISVIAEGTIPSMLQQPLVGSISKTAKPHDE